MKKGRLERAEYLRDLRQVRKKNIDRFYLGNEFCEFLLPSIQQINGIVNKIGEKGKEVTIVTPPVSSFYIKKIRGLLKSVEKSNVVTELVVNDFGVLRLLHKEFPYLQLAIGRLLSHQLLSSHTFKRVCVKEIDRLINKYNIRRIELNNQFTEISQYNNLFNHGFRGSLNFPSIYLTSSLHNCPMQGCKKKEVSIKSLFACERDCKEYKVIFHYSKESRIFEDWDGVIFLEGKAKFINTWDTMNLKQEWIDRIVLNYGIQSDSFF
jgi:hypothetical protein